LPTLSANDRLALAGLCALTAGALLLGGLARGSFEPDAQRPQARLNLNRASPAELAALPGLGPTLARRAVVYRQTHGAYRTIGALRRVRGIGPATVERLRPHLAVAADPSDG